MSTCPDCTYVEEQVNGDNRYKVIDIGLHVRDLKAFLKLRDHNPVFDEAKKAGAAGIPCFVNLLLHISAVGAGAHSINCCHNSV